jgi:hypothetical protein
VTLTFDPLSPKSTGVICWSWPITIPCLKFLGINVLKLSLGNQLVYGPTDRQMQSNIPPLLWSGGIIRNTKKNSFFTLFEIYSRVQSSHKLIDSCYLISRFWLFGHLHGVTSTLVPIYTSIHKTMNILTEFEILQFVHRQTYLMFF